MLAAIPGTSFADPLGPIDPVSPEAQVPAVPQDSDPTSANGSATG
jgi:hypothetical protein